MVKLVPTGLVDKYEMKKQMTALDSHLGLGDWRHRTRVLQFIKSIRETLAEIAFYWSAQRGLDWADTLRYFLIGGMLCKILLLTHIN
jgi:hypothetical protein